MTSGRRLLRRWGFPAAAAAAVAVLIAVNLNGIADGPSATGAPGRSPAPPAPVLRSPTAGATGATGATGPDDHYRSCRTQAPSWHTTATDDRVFTRDSALTVGAGAGVTGVAVESVRVLTSQVVFGAGDATALTADQVLGVVRSQHRVRIAGPGSTTPSAARMVSVPAGHHGGERRYVAYTGWVAWSGSWSFRWCAEHFWHTASGTWSSFEPVAAEGLALCGLGERDLTDHYPAGSWDRRACVRG